MSIPHKLAGWAEEAGIPIVCVHRNGTVISQSLKMLVSAVMSYETPSELIEKLTEYLRFHPT
mgnify:CR=1